MNVTFLKMLVFLLLFLFLPFSDRLFFFFTPFFFLLASRDPSLVAKAPVRNYL